MKFCQNCGGEVPNQAGFCPKCGASCNAQSQINPQTVQAAPKSSSKVGIIVLVVVLVVLALAGLTVMSVVTKVKRNLDSVVKEISEEVSKAERYTTTSTTKVTSNDPANDTYDKDADFLMAIEDVFTISGRGTVVTGKIESGSIKVGDTVDLVGLNKDKTVEIVGIEMFRKNLDEANAGDNVGILLKDVSREEVERGQVLVKKDSLKAHTKFEADIKVLSKEDGGRHTPFFNNYRPQFYFRTTDTTGVVTLPEGTEMIMPGDETSITVEITAPIAMSVGTEFAIREGGRTIGSGTVTNVIE